MGVITSGTNIVSPQWKIEAEAYGALISKEEWKGKALFVPWDQLEYALVTYPDKPDEVLVERPPQASEASAGADSSVNSNRRGNVGSGKGSVSTK